MISLPHILLLQLSGELQFADSEPLSIEILASALDRLNPGIRRDLCLWTDSNPQRIQDLQLQKYDIVGISIPQGTYELACLILDELARLSLPPLVVLGHALPTYSPQLFFERYPDAILVSGWGEDAFVQIVQQKIAGNQDWKEIPGVVFFQNGQITRTKIIWPRKYTFPVRWNVDRYFSRVESSRGCSHNMCTFCTRPPISPRHKPWMRFPIPEVIHCVEDLVARGVHRFTFTDEDFIGDDLDQALTFAESLRKIGDIQFSISIRVDDVYNPGDSELDQQKRLRLFEILKEAGLSLVFLGTESLSDSQLKRYGKGVTVEDNVRAVQFLDQLKIETELGFILFDPFLSIEELIENLENLHKTGFWAKIGSLPRQLRIQEGCAFKITAEKKGILRAYQPSTMSYNYEYVDPIISAIAKTYIQWNEDIKPVYKVVRDVYRAKFAQNETRSSIIDFRELTFFYLLDLVDSYLHLNDRDLQTNLFELDFVEERYKWIKVLREEAIALMQTHQIERSFEVEDVQYRSTY